VRPSAALPTRVGEDQLEPLRSPLMRRSSPDICFSATWAMKLSPDRWKSRSVRRLSSDRHCGRKAMGVLLVSVFRAAAHGEAAAAALTMCEA
jgi:hypothetical protein